MLDETVRWFAERSAVDPDELCSSTRFIRFLDADGGVVHEREHRHRFSAWNTIYRALLAEFPPERYLLGREVVGLAPDGDGMRLSSARGRPPGPTWSSAPTASGRPRGRTCCPR